MGYPYGPQQGYDPYAGQGYAQPGYGAQPYAAPGPQYGYGAPVYGAAPYGPMPGYGQPRASGGTAITAALLALALSMLGGVSVLVAMAAMSEIDGAASDAMAVPLVIGGGACLLWFVGSILLFRRKAAGRAILIILSSLALVGIGISTAITLDSGAEPGPALVGSAIGGGLALLILCLAAAGSTGRWIREGRQPVQGPYPYY
ncbi:hypothetical protein [Nocardia sp. AG03]|uniref:hypothetical protein n=1 Tax=Nocardia sp. AG03 TaxID=3025312 RepID=UPI002418B29C|nr:hypothetical protein [Nocardia sp. AG03]